MKRNRLHPAVQREREQRLRNRITFAFAYVGLLTFVAWVLVHLAMEGFL